MMRKIRYYIVIFVFLFYWLSTFIFVSPNNFIKILLHEEEQLFTTFFFQKWGFFAPPPNYNDRLYYTFELKKDSTFSHTFEVMEPLQKRKSSNAPFNSSEDILDYILSTTVHSITDGLIAVNQSIDYEYEIKKTTDSITFDIDTLKFNRGKNYVQSTPNFQTLKRYAILVAKRHDIENLNDYYLTIDIIQSPMPKFADREKIGVIRPEIENLIFKSDKIEFQ